MTAISLSAPEFQSTHPMRDATHFGSASQSLTLFQSTHPMRDATHGQHTRYPRKIISIHASHAGCDMDLGAYSQFASISIHASHASHAGCDRPSRRESQPGQTISIHASHAGCDFAFSEPGGSQEQFQSTHPMRDATVEAVNAIDNRDISIHASHAGCDILHASAIRNNQISIHASHAGCDGNLWAEYSYSLISIHASHAGCDIDDLGTESSMGNFNPRIPCGMRRRDIKLMIILTLFQSTHPMRDATPRLAGSGK